MVHHLDGPGTADLFVRVAERLCPGGRFILADLVVPSEPADAVKPVGAVHDTPCRADEQLAWLAEAGLRAGVAWNYRDLAVLVAGRSSPGRPPGRPGPRT